MTVPRRRHSLPVLALLGASAALTAAAGPASAATVSVERVCTGSAGAAQACSRRVHLKAGAGEVNRITFSGPGAFDRVDVQDATETIADTGDTALKVGEGCTLVSPEQAVCNANTVKNTDTLSQSVLDLGDMADTAVVQSGLVTITGGAGNDRLTAGGDTMAELLGQGGRDRLKSTGAATVMAGGAGGDRITGRKAPGREEDTIDGGSGRDRIVAGADGGRVNGGTGNDVIEGGDASDILFGDRGDDEISGGDGDDTIDGGPGADVIDAGAGKDKVATEDNAKLDKVSCGGGRDSVLIDRGDRFRGCEKVRRG